MIAGILAFGFFLTLHQYWVPGHSGVDQNGYLVGGKMFARTLSMGMTPADVYGFVGRMWISTPEGTFFPKYPLGYPLLVAMALWVGGSSGTWLAFWINPVDAVGAGGDLSADAAGRERIPGDPGDDHRRGESGGAGADEQSEQPRDDAVRGGVGDVLFVSVVGNGE